MLLQSLSIGWVGRVTDTGILLTDAVIGGEHNIGIRIESLLAKRHESDGERYAHKLIGYLFAEGFLIRLIQGAQDYNTPGLRLSALQRFL